MDEHKPVLVDAVLAALAVQSAGLYVDATFGRGGHSACILTALGPAGRLIAIDRDPEAIAAGRQRFSSEPRLVLLQGSFDQMATLVRQVAAARPVDGILLDCGVSSPQLDSAARGFSFRQDGPLDMRMDPAHGEALAVWLARASSDEIRHVIATLGEERFARRIADAITRARASAPISRTRQLAEIAERAVPTREPGKHPATRTFQALRMFINDELGQLQRALPQSLELLAGGGRLAVISFHSLEDGVVRDFMRRHATVDPALLDLPEVPAAARPQLKLVGRKQRATPEEIAANPRARSALLRVAEKLSSEAA